MDSPNTASDASERHSASAATIAGLSLLACLVAVLWAFPRFWYTAGADRASYAWFEESQRIPGWVYTAVPVGQAAESILVADRIVNGVFRQGSAEIKTYSAKRFLHKENEIGLFSHTPDRCWIAVGWSMEPAQPDHVTIDVHGVSIAFERRIFHAGTHRELVLFGALVGGRPLPYRLDHYLRSGQASKNGGTDAGTAWTRIRQARLWSWAWDSFRQRTPLAGPQQFVRISTPILQSDENAAEQRLRDFLGAWLIPSSFEADRAAHAQGPGETKSR